MRTAASVLKGLGAWLVAAVVYAWHWFQMIDYVVYKEYGPVPVRL